MDKEREGEIERSGVMRKNEGRENRENREVEEREWRKRYEGKEREILEK